MRETGFSHVVLNTAHSSQLGALFSALGWQIQQTPINEDTTTFWGLGTASELTRCVAPAETWSAVVAHAP